MIKKRNKITFEIINKDKYEIIPPEKIMESNFNIKTHMRKFLKKIK